MRRILTLILMQCAVIGFGQKSIKVVAEDTPKVAPLNLALRIAKDSCFCKHHAPKFFEKIADTLGKIGTVYDLSTDDWYFDDLYLANIFNKAYKTKVGDNIICSRRLYFTNASGIPTEDWIQVKEWSYRTPNDAKTMYELITKKEFVSDYMGPRNWDCVLDGNRLYFLCGAAADFWETNSDYLKKIIVQKLFL